MTERQNRGVESFRCKECVCLLVLCPVCTTVTLCSNSVCTNTGNKVICCYSYTLTHKHTRPKAVCGRGVFLTTSFIHSEFQMISYEMFTGYCLSISALACVLKCASNYWQYLSHDYIMHTSQHFNNHAVH